MARKHFYDKGLEKKNRIITLNGSFHGRTLGTIAAAGEEKLTKGFGPNLLGFDQVTSGNLTEFLDCIDCRKKNCKLLNEKPKSVNQYQNKKPDPKPASGSGFLIRGISIGGFLIGGFSIGGYSIGDFSIRG